LDPSYDVLAATLSEAGAPIGLSELHGGLCAALCAGGVVAARRWMEACYTEWTCAGAGNQDAIRAPLEHLQLQTWRALAGSDMSFTPLLPDDDDELTARVEALALWCHGFVSSLGLAGKGFAAGDDSDELVELIGDFVEISKAGLDPKELQDDQQAEFTLVELVEYVRIGVQYVYEELARDREQPSRDTIH